MVDKQIENLRILRTKEVMDRVSWSRTTLWRKVRAGEFPRPLQLGANSIGFYEHEVDAAIKAFPRVAYPRQGELHGGSKI